MKHILTTRLSLGHRQFFVFCPLRGHHFRRSWCGFCLRRFCRSGLQRTFGGGFFRPPGLLFLWSGRSGQVCDFFAESFRGRHLAVAAIGGNHAGKYIGGGKGNLRDGRLGSRPFQRQRVFELMRQFTQLAQPARGRVALQGVYRAPNDAHDFLVAGLFLQLQRFIVQRLQEFLRSLKEELPQFRATLIGGFRHSLTSIR